MNNNSKHTKTKDTNEIILDIEEGIIYPYSFLLEKYRHAIFYKNINSHY